jgi:hypothetical protein
VRRVRQAHETGGAPYSFTLLGNVCGTRCAPEMCRASVARRDAAWATRGDARAGWGGEGMNERSGASGRVWKPARLTSVQGGACGGDVSGGRRDSGQ